MARVTLSRYLSQPLSHPSILASSAGTSSASRSATLLAPMLLISVNISTIVLDVSITPQTTPKTGLSSPARVTTRTTPASTQAQTVRSRHTLSLLSLWVLSPQCHTSPRSPLLPTVLLTLRPPSIMLFLPPAVSPLPLTLVSPLAPGPPLLDLPTLPEATAVITVLQVSRSDPSSSLWAQVLSELSLPFSLWPELRQQIYHYSIPSLQTRYDYVDLRIAPFGLRTD